MKTPRLQVLIACYEKIGIERIVNANHPQVDGVEYVVSWQLPNGIQPIPTALANRPDFNIYIHHDKGLASNRNHALEAASAEILLISDDDVTYTTDELKQVISAFDNNPSYDIIAFRYDSDHPKTPVFNTSFNLKKPRRGWYISSIELAVRKKAISNTRFNEHFGVNSSFVCGEEGLFLHDLMKKGHNGLFLPLTICYHPGATTSSRLDPELTIAAKGAIFLHMHPHTWGLYMLRHALRKPFKSSIQYCMAWIRGVRKAKQLNVFGK